MKDLHVLECYRSVLFQRPPNLYSISTSALHGPKYSNNSSIPNNRENHAFLKTIKALMTPDGPSIKTTDSSQSLHTLSALLVISWHSMPTNSTTSSEEGLWKRSYFELALNRWLKTYGKTIEDSTMLLFHLSSVVLHTNMANIHGLVHNFLQPNPNVSIPEVVNQWRNSDHCKIAVLHANLLTQAAHKITASQRSRSYTASNSAGGQTPPPTLAEGPHAAICVYLAILVLWATEIASEDTNWEMARSMLEKGCNILSQFKIRIATVLMNTLRRLWDNIV